MLRISNYLVVEFLVMTWAVSLILINRHFVYARIILYIACVFVAD
jgi:hypothetical protein